MGALVLALNPSIDAEWCVERVQWEEKNVVQSERRWAGGKGVNVARWLRHLGGSPKLLLPLGGNAGRELHGYLRAEKIPIKTIPLRESTRVNVIVTTGKAGQLRFNPPGPNLSNREWLAILRNTQRHLEKTSCLLLSGSLPQGVSKDVYKQLIHVAHRAGLRTILDCDGEALKLAIQARPFLVKPNESELAQWCGKPLRSKSSILKAAYRLSETTRGWVMVSLGKRGAMLVNAREQISFFAKSPLVRPVNTVGAGDALVAAVARQIEIGALPQEWLRHGVAVGTAATQCAAGVLPKPLLSKKILSKVTLHDV